MASGDTKTESYLRTAAEGTRADLPSDNCCNTKTQNLIVGVAERIMDVEDEVEEMKNNPDVVDIVATYADLQAYDTSKLTDKDVIRVLTDSTHDDESTYYRYSKQTGQFTYIGTSKQYTNFVGTDGTTAGVNGLVPAPATTDTDKFLKSDGTWDTAGGGVTPVQTTGTSTTDVMSQNATSSMVFADPGTDTQIKIGHGTTVASNNSIAIGNGAGTYGSDSFRSLVIGNSAHSEKQDAVALGALASITGTGNFGVAIGRAAGCSKKGSVALGTFSNVSYAGEVNIGSTDPDYGYNNTNYRLLTGVHDPVNAHDAATKGFVDGKVLSGAGAPTTSTVGTMGQLYEDTTNGKLYQCTAVSGSTYTWSEVGAGGLPQYGDIVNIGSGNTVDSSNSVGVVIGKNAQLQSSANQSIRIGTGGLCWGPYSVAIGYNAQSAAGNHGSENGSIAIGRDAISRSNAEIAIGAWSGAPSANLLGAVSLGAYSKATRTGEVNIGSSNASYGFNSTNYRVIGGVHDGQLANDAVTVNQVNATIDAINTALSTNIPHIGA